MNAGDPAFLDTNIIVYAFDRAQPGKRTAAHTLVRSLIIDQRAVVSVQVLCEFFVTVTRKIARPLTADTARRIVSLLSQTCTVVAANSQDVLEAIDAMRKYHMQFWDAMIWATARRRGCAVIYGEDFQHQQSVEGVRFINPFLP